jgi:hypothetical protein
VSVCCVYEQTTHSYCGAQFLREKCAKISGKNWTASDFVFLGDACIADFLENFEN